jgi:hypothetical protein
MRAHQVDPRDIQWEADTPSYRVYFWQQAGHGPESGWASDEWQLDDGDLLEVLAWADSDDRHRRYVLYACCAHGGDPGLIRLTGTDPTAAA